MHQGPTIQGLALLSSALRCQYLGPRVSRRLLRLRHGVCIPGRAGHNRDVVSGRPGLHGAAVLLANKTQGRDRWGWWPCGRPDTGLRASPGVLLHARDAKGVRLGFWSPNTQTYTQTRVLSVSVKHVALSRCSRWSC